MNCNNCGHETEKVIKCEICGRNACNNCYSQEFNACFDCLNEMWPDKFDWKDKEINDWGRK